MSFWSRRYVNIKRKHHRAQPVQFFSVLKTYKTVLVHPVMEPGREVFSLHTVEDIVEKKGTKNVDLLLDEKLAFFFRNISSKKIVYKEFSSPFASPYKELRKQLSGKSYDVYVDLNRFSEDIMTLFGSAITSKVQICIDGAKENPVFNMVIAAEKQYADIERNNLILNPLGIKNRRKGIKWKKPVARKKDTKAIAIALKNERLGLEWYTFLRRKGFDPVLFVSGNTNIAKLKQKSGVNAVSIYPLEKAYDSCSVCVSFIVSINPIFSIGYLLKRRMLLVPEKGETIQLPDDIGVELFSLKKGSPSPLERIKVFTESP
jgi:hypothetical protein